MSKNVYSQMAFSSNLNTITLKIFPNHVGIYRFERKFRKCSGERQNPKWYLETRRCIC